MEIIYAYVCQCGYSGHPATLASYIDKVNKDNFPEQKSLHPLKMLQGHYPEGVEVVSRSSLLKYDF